MNDEPERPIAWTAIQRHAHVYSSDDANVGIVEEVLGTGEVGIFHGIVVRHHLMQSPVEVPAAEVDVITNLRIGLKLDEEAFKALPPHVEEKAFALGIRGIFRHRPGWVDDYKA